MISASHNPFYDNGIKIVNSKGEKIDDDFIDKIELYLDGKLEQLGVSGNDIPYATGADVGEIVDYFAGRNRYIGYLISLSRHSFRNFRIGLDCANGGAWMIAKSVFDALGAKTYTINASPDGTNINEGAGSTHIEGLCKYVKENNLDMGFAFDGDADRCLAVDEHGEVVNGDHILYILGTWLKKNGELNNNTVVTTVMSNLGLYNALDKAGIKYEQTKVGDRFVYENMQANGHSIGGEQSGHIILSKYATTGDGILTAIKLVEAVIEAKSTLGTLASNVKMLPQTVINIRVADKAAVKANAAVTAAVESVRESLGKSGRILVRESGTEPLMRVMVEAETAEICQTLAESVINVIRKEGLANEK